MDKFKRSRWYYPVVMATACLFLFGIGRVVAQQTGGTQTAQQSSHYDSCTNQVASGATPVTLTIAAPPNSNWSTYIAELDMGAWTTAAPTAGAGTVTSAGFTNNSVWTFEFPATANLNWNPSAMNFGPGGWKSTQNASVTFTSSTFTSVSAFIHACYWQAP